MNDEDPTCPRCGGYFDEYRPYWARGLHRKCYLSAWYRRELDLYPVQRPFSPVPRRGRWKVDPVKPPPPCPQCGREICTTVGRCRECAITLRLTLTSAMRGLTRVRHCPHLIERRNRETTAS